MSGYTRRAIFRHGVQAEGNPLMQEPFTAAILSRKVREVLDAP